MVSGHQCEAIGPATHSATTQRPREPKFKQILTNIEREEWGKGEEEEWIVKEGDLMTKCLAEQSEWETLKKQLNTVLIAKTEAEARRLIKNEQGDGFMGYMRLNKWFMESSGKAILDRISALTHPSPAKTEKEMFEKVERWEEEAESETFVEFFCFGLPESQFIQEN